MNEILKRYDVEVRANPTGRPGMHVVRDTHVTYLEGSTNFVCWWNFSEAQAAQEVSRLVQRFRQRGESLMWRVFDHDQPKNLSACLSDEGFTSSPQGTLMVLSLAEYQAANLTHDIREVTTPEGLRDYLSVAAAAFGSVDEGAFDDLLPLLDHPNYLLYCGYADNVPVTSGRLNTTPNAAFGLLFGGGTVPAHRGKGYYRALVQARAAGARERGLSYLTTEAWDTSRPILETMGFNMLDKETTWVLPVGSAPTGG